MSKRMLVTDLDGTLAYHGVVGEKALASMKALGERKIVRVIATGRSLHGARRVLGDDFPVDYLVFSSGAGVLDWRDKTVMRSSTMELGDVQSIARALSANEFNFMVHDPIPENHLFAFHHGEAPCDDFLRRLDRNRGFSRPLKTLSTPASQFVVILPPNKIDDILKLRSLFPKQSLIRATSPLDNASAWLEIFSPGICKSEACEWLCAKLSISSKNVLAVGNDYNDHDLLEWAGTAMLVENSPEDLGDRFQRLDGFGVEGFSEAVRLWISE